MNKKERKKTKEFERVINIEDRQRKFNTWVIEVLKEEKQRRKQILKI